VAARRGSSFAIAVAVAIGAATVARAATPAAHVARIDRVGDERLDVLVAAVRAELRAAGFKVAPDRAGPDSGEATAASVITVSVERGHAVVVATAAGTASAFSAEVEFTDAGAARRDVNRVALQVAEWLAAIWLPPPARAPWSSPSPSQPPVAAPPAPLEPFVPPPFETTPAVPLPPSLASATLRAVRGAPPAPSRIALFDFGFGLLRAPDFGAQLGFDLGVALHGTSSIVLGATPFARLGLGLYWLGSSFGAPASSTQAFDVNFASLTAAAGLRLPLVDKISVEASAGFGFALVWVTVNTTAVASTIGPSVTAYPNDRTWVATPGGAVAVVCRFSQRWALAGELRASWMVPGLVFVAGDFRFGGSDAPLMVGTLGLRITL